ncbi:hypothetical protein RJ639_031788 [Escallonia herrerae]|uniref:Transmembrane protein 18 n=1 Tax=Escallonia herrerae TaxID=1293975 RepID=A0AA88WZD4_9ASTE|nr:hypothetical protein RJ639_031788 [Escallonia herrerae]
MEELKSAMNEHLDQMADLVEKFTVELRSGLKPATDNFIGFFHAIDWKEPWLMSLILFYVVLLLVTFLSRKNINYQMCLFLFASIILESKADPSHTNVAGPMGGVYLAERLNSFLGNNWKSFAGQNYFDQHGLFLSVLWSGPLLVIAIIILVNTLFSLCQLIVRWKKAELRHRARLSLPGPGTSLNVRYLSPGSRSRARSMALTLDQ